MRSIKLDEMLKVYGECLSPQSITDLKKMRSGNWNEFEYKFVDFELLGAFYDVCPDLNSDMLTPYIKDEKYTKRFSHRQQTFEQLLKYDCPDTPSFTYNKYYRKARKDLVKAMTNNLSGKLNPMRVKDEEDLFELWSNKDASAGAIGIGSKEKNVKEILYSVSKLESEIAINNSPIIPAIAYHRAQISRNGETKQKDRLVWGIDAATNSIEGKYARPLINHLVGNWYNYAGGLNPYELRERVNQVTGRSKNWLSSDYSGFDQTVPAWIIKDCFKIIKEEFFSPEFYQELDWICQRFICTHILFSNDVVYVKTKGIPSGSYFTQVIGSMVNFLLYVTFLWKSGVMPNCVEKDRINLLVMGDDSLLGYYGFFDLNAFSSYILKNFGVKIGVEKTKSGSTVKLERPEFLKREWHGFEGEYRNPYEVIANSIHPEHVRNYKGYTPYMIIFGLYCIYKKAFNRIDEIKLRENLGSDFNSEYLTRLAMGNDLPGVFQAFKDKTAEFLGGELKRIWRLRNPNG